MSRLTKGIAVLALLFVPSAGCTGSCVAEPEREHATDSSQGDKVSLETIQAILAQSKEGLTSTKELVDKIATLNSDLAEEAKVFEAQEILRAIPLELETEKTKQQIRSAVEALELRAQRIQVEYHEVREKKGLPRYYSDAPPYPFVDDELEEVIRIQIDIPESTPDQLSALAESLIRSEPRLLKPLPIEHHDGFSRLRTEMFRFRQISPPTQSFSPPSKELLSQQQVPGR